jgi:hypothetical protein
VTIVEFQSRVDAAITVYEWEVARVRWRQGLLEERAAIEKALPLAGTFGIEAEPLEARLGQIAVELTGDVTADRVPQHPVRSVPLDMIATAVIRRILRVPADYPFLTLSGIKTVPTDTEVAEAVADVAKNWSNPKRQSLAG